MCCGWARVEAVEVVARRRRRSNYYGSKRMTRAERLALLRAAEVEGLGDEIALLPARLKQAMEAAPRTVKARRGLKAATEAIETMLRAVAVKKRTSPRARVS